MSELICPGCGFITDEDFCLNCGAILQNQPPVAAPEVTSQQISPANLCPRCHNIITTGKKFCAFCGYELSKIIISEIPPEEHCQKCGSKIAPGEEFCSACEEEETVIVKTVEQEVPPEDYCPKCGSKIATGEEFCSACEEEETVIVKTVEQEAPPEEHCRKCGSKIAPGEEFCSSCEEEETVIVKTVEQEILPEDYCPKCGSKIPPGEEFCSACEEETVIVKTGEDVRPPEEQFSSPVIFPDEKISAPSEETEELKPEAEEIPPQEPPLLCVTPSEEKISAPSEETKELKPEAEEIPPQEPLLLCVTPSEEKISTPSEETEELKSEPEEIPPQEPPLLCVTSSEEKVSAPSAEEVRKETVEAREEKSDKGSQGLLDKNGYFLGKKEKPGSKEINWTYVSLSLIAALVIIVSGIILHNAGRASSNDTAGKTPPPFSTVIISPRPDLTEISLASQTMTPAVDLTETPEPIKPSPTEEIKMAYNPVPTPVPTPLPTAIPAVPTNIPTRISGYRKPIENVVFKPYDTPVPTEIDYYKVHRTYCDSTINNKIIPLYNAGNYQEVIVECNNLISLDKNYYVNYIWMASSYLACRDTIDAKYYIDMAWKLEYTETRVSYEVSESKKLYDTYHNLGGKD